MSCRLQITVNNCTPQTDYPRSGKIPDPTPGTCLDWSLFDIPVPRILAYIAAKTGQPVTVISLHETIPGASKRCPDLQFALREGLRNRLHLNLGTPGIEEPDHPIEENAIALYAALLLGQSNLPVILSGQLELAVHEGLISAAALDNLRRYGWAYA